MKTRRLRSVDIFIFFSLCRKIMASRSFSYRTIQQPVTGSYKEKGSKFFSFAYPVQTESEIKEHLVALKKEFFDARHHCYAWVLGADKKQFRSFDDGEPNHSAGDPILGQIRSKDLTDVLIVVVRYFGGTKLGVGGLITAYRQAAEDALAHALIIEREVVEFIQIKYDYAATPEVMRVVKEFSLVIVEHTFGDGSTLHVQVALRDLDKIMERLALLKATGSPLSFR